MNAGMGWAVEERYILLVEDNRDDEVLTLRALQKANVVNKVDVVRDGAEALSFLDEVALGHRPPPAVILLDLNLPKVNGLGVLRRMRARDETRLLPVVVLTSSLEEEDRLSAYDLGTNAYLRKPVAFEPFIEAVRVVGVFWLLLNEPPPRNGVGPVHLRSPEAAG